MTNCMLKVVKKSSKYIFDRITKQKRAKKTYSYVVQQNSQKFVCLLYKQEFQLSQGFQKNLPNTKQKMTQL